MASPSKAVIKWAAGILATVISSVLIYYLTTPKPPVPAEASTQIEGRVIDLATRSLVEGARVTLRAGKYSGSQSTDSLGRYGFDVPLPQTTEATFIIEAAGYPAYSVNGTLKKLSAVEDNQLLHEALPGVSASTGGPASTAPSPSPQPGSSAVGGMTGGGKGALVGALAGHTPAIVQPLPRAAASAQVQDNIKTTAKLAPYIRRSDLVKVGP
jgi:hypothetical protein